MSRRKASKARRQKRAAFAAAQEAVYDDVPKSFVIRHGTTAKCIASLVKDIRSMMQPWTATKLEERKDNTLKDFVSVTGMLKITHMIVLCQTGPKVFFKLSRMPGGPTLTFAVDSYSLSGDIVRAGGRAASPKDYQSTPLTVLSGFRSPEDEGSTMDPNVVRLMQTTFNGLFPTIDIRDIRQNNRNRRVVLFAYRGEGQIEIRQYVVGRKIAGVSPAVERLLDAKRGATKRKIIETHDGLDSILDQVKQVKEEPMSSDEETPPKKLKKKDAGVVSVTHTFVKYKKSKKVKEEEEEDGDVDDSASVTSTRSTFEKEITRLTVGMNIELHEVGPRLSMHVIKSEDSVFGGEVLWEHKE